MDAVNYFIDATYNSIDVISLSKDAEYVFNNAESIIIKKVYLQHKSSFIARKYIILQRN